MRVKLSLLVIQSSILSRWWVSLKVMPGFSLITTDFNSRKGCQNEHKNLRISNLVPNTVVSEGESKNKAASLITIYLVVETNMGT